MIKQFLEWLKAIYYHPATTAETQSSGVTMTDVAVDTAAQTAAATVAAVAATAVADTATTATTTDTAPAATVVTADVAPVVAVAASTDATTTDTTSTSALAEFKTKIEAFVEFVEHGIKVLGADAEAELVALKDKYL